MSWSTPRFSAKRCRLHWRICRHGWTPARCAGPQLRVLGPITLRDMEMQAIHQSLERNGGNKPKAAEELGISLKTLYNKLHNESGLEKSA